MGTVDKIYIEFPHRWWPTGRSGVSFVWRKEDIEKMPENLLWTTGVLGFYAEDNHHTTLCGWIVGEHAEAMEKANDEEV